MPAQSTLPTKPRSTDTEAEIAISLASRIAEGDSDAEGELVERYSRGLLFMLRRRSGRRDLAEDLHQETFRIVLERLRHPGLEDPSRLMPFLHRTAENLFLTHWRQGRRRRSESDGEAGQIADAGPSQLDRTLRGEAASLVRQVLRELRPRRDRQILYRFYLAEEPKNHICTDLGLNSLQFNRVLHRARQRLRDLMERRAKQLKVATFNPQPQPRTLGRSRSENEREATTPRR